MKTEEQKLVEFFRDGVGAELGRRGDYDSLTPAETAIRAMREMVTHASHCKRLRTKLYDAGVV